MIEWQLTPSPDRRKTLDDDENTILYQPDKNRAGNAAAPSDITLPTGFTLGEFVIERTIGIGGFGVVYLARDMHLQRYVAIKEYLPNTLAFRGGDHTVTLRSADDRDVFEAGMKSFVNEALTLARLDHPGVVKVHQFWEENKTAYMVMPYYDGVTLAKQMANHPAKHDKTKLAALLDDLLAALEYLHSQQIYHRDISPENIFIQGNGRPLLLDFGAARRVIDNSSNLTVILRPGYAPIEQYDQLGLQGPWTDIYALAAVCYELLSGIQPIPSVTRMVRDPLVPLTDLRPAGIPTMLLAGLNAALAIKPDERPQNIDIWRNILGIPKRSYTVSLVDDLEVKDNLTSNSPLSPSQATKPNKTAQAKERTVNDPQETRDGSRSKTRRIAFGVVAAIGVSVGAIYLLQTGTDPNTTSKAPSTPMSSSLNRSFGVGAEHQGKPQNAPTTPVKADERAITANSTPVDNSVPGQAPEAPHGWLITLKPKKTSYEIGTDRIAVSAVSEKTGYLYYFTVDPKLGTLLLTHNGKVSRKIVARKQTELPNPMASEPVGKQTFFVIVSQFPREAPMPRWQPLGRKGSKADFYHIPDADNHSDIAALLGPPRCPANVATAICNDYAQAAISVNIRH